MDPYAILDIPQGASEADLKKAFRKKAMKWHPDRVGTSVEAKERFFEISHAYKILSREIRKNATQQQSSSREGQEGQKSSNDDLIFNELLEYAIKLANSGYTRKGIKLKVEQKGCDDKMADSISKQAVEFLQNSSDPFDTENTEGENLNKYRMRKFDYRSIASVLGEHNPKRSSMKKISYYLNIFNDLYSEIEAGAIIPSSKNRYLAKVFNRSVLFFIIIAISIYYLPVLSRLIPLGLIDFFQLPHILLSLILVWSMYRKLWLLSIIGVLVIAATQMYYYHYMPISLEQDFKSVLLTAGISYLPFIFFTRGANFFFYLKAKNIIASAQHYNSELEDQLILIRSSGGISRLSALLATIFLGFYFLQMIPENGSLYNKYSLLFPSSNQVVNKDFKQIQALANQSELLFNTAEANFHLVPPNYEQARLNYIGSANYGSLLSCYKAGYMFLTGLGGDQDDTKAFRYFSQAIRAPLSKQPHNLSMVTRWLAESYNTLGIMYLGGYGTSKDRVKANEMFSLARKYGLSNSAQKLLISKSIHDKDLRKRVTYPDY